MANPRQNLHNNSSRYPATSTSAIPPLEAKMASLQIDGNGGKSCHNGGKKSARGLHAPGKTDEVERSAKAARMQRGGEGEVLVFPSQRAKRMMMGRVRYGQTDEIPHVAFKGGQGKRVYMTVDELALSFRNTSLAAIKTTLLQQRARGAWAVLSELAKINQNVGKEKE